VAIRRAESDMVELNNHVLHWRPEENRWVEIAWDDFCAFREFFTPSRRGNRSTHWCMHFRSRRAQIALRPTSWTKSRTSRRTDNEIALPSRVRISAPLPGRALASVSAALSEEMTSS